MNLKNEIKQELERNSYECTEGDSCTHNTPEKEAFMSTDLFALLLGGTAVSGLLKETEPGTAEHAELTEMLERTRELIAQHYSELN